MKHSKQPLLYQIDFLHNLESSFFCKKNNLVFVLFLFILVAPKLSFASPFSSLISSLSSHNEQKISARVSNFLDAHDSITPQMKERAIQKVIDFNANFKINPTNEAKTVRHLFFAVQETFLKEYVLYSSFFQTIDSGKYDCLTGSVLYAVLLEEIKQKGNFNYTYELIQNPIHVFIKIKLSDGTEIIFESTSLERGFIATPKGIDFYLQEQAKKVEQVVQDEILLLENENGLNNLLTLENAPALLYFNQGVLFFNQRKFGKALKMTKKAFYLQKNETFYKLVQLCLNELNKEEYIDKNKNKLDEYKFILVNN